MLRDISPRVAVTLPVKTVQQPGTQWRYCVYHEKRYGIPTVLTLV